MLAGDVVHVARDALRIEKGLLCLLRLHTSRTDVVEVGLIPIKVRFVGQSAIRPCTMVAR